MIRGIKKMEDIARTKGENVGEGKNVLNGKCQVPGVGNEMSTTPKAKVGWISVEMSCFVCRMSGNAVSRR